jgi:hypothetical protein
MEMGQSRAAMQQKMTAAERVAQEDLVLFINACFACTGQSEFYGASESQSVSIRFVHEYILGNYRRLYARTLAAGVNHYNQGLIIQNLLRAGAPGDPAQRREEGELILAALLALPPQRAYHLFRDLRQLRCNNRRTRAVMAAYLSRRPDLRFDAVKYRAQVRALAAHAHLPLPDEVGAFVFVGPKSRTSYQTPLFESVRRAHYAAEAVYDLPYTIALGFARKHRIPRDVFLSRIAGRMTAHEALRLLDSAERHGATGIDVDLSRVPLTKLCLYLLDRPLCERRERAAEFSAALRASAQRACARAGRSGRLGRVVAILDRSYSSSGSEEKRRRPLAVALATSQILRAVSADYRAIWTPALSDPAVRGEAGDASGPTDPGAEQEILVTAQGQTALAEPLLAALSTQPELIVIVSDGFENDPQGASETIVRLFRQHLDRKRAISILHANPVFDSDRLMPRSLGPSIPTLGLRDAEDLLTMIGFARFADGSAPLSELEQYLEARVSRLLRRLARPGDPTAASVAEDAPGRMTDDAQDEAAGPADDAPAREGKAEVRP